MYHLVLLLFTAQSSLALLGFDCGGRHLNITSVSLLDVGECNLPHKTSNSTDTYIQLLQLSEYNHAFIIQCKVEISRTIYYCGMHSHVSIMHNGRADYIHETGHSQCKRMFRDGTFSLGTRVLIDGIRINQTASYSITIAGSVGNDGKCKGTQYSDNYGTWDDVVVQAVARISLKSAYVPVKLNTGKIMLKSKTICTLSEGFCIDSEDGYTYWEPMPTSSCNFHQYDVLYEGPAIKTTDDTSEEKSPIVYSLTTQDITFALTRTREQPLCGYTLLRTEHPKLFILETKKGDVFAERGTIPIVIILIFSHI